MWSFQKEMEFLLAYMGNRSIQNQNYSTDDYLSEVTAEESVYEEEEEEEDIQEEPDEQPLQVHPFVVTVKEELISPEPAVKRKKSDLTSLMKETLKEYGQRSRERQLDRKQILVEQLNDPERNDALLQFFMSMYHTTKSMPKDVQIQIRKVVFETVTKAEEDLLLTEQ